MGTVKILSDGIYWKPNRAFLLCWNNFAIRNIIILKQSAMRIVKIKFRIFTILLFPQCHTLLLIQQTYLSPVFLQAFLHSSLDTVSRSCYLTIWFPYWILFFQEPYMYNLFVSSWKDSSRPRDDLRSSEKHIILIIRSVLLMALSEL